MVTVPIYSYYNIPNGMTTNYSYDSRNRLTAIEHKDGANVLDGFTYALDDVGNITQTTHEDGSFWEYGYDGRYRLTSAVRSNANETIEATYAYTYDDGDNLLTKVEPFEDDFNDGNYTGWSVWSGTWSAANNHLHMTPGTAATIAKANTDNDNELRFTYVNNDTSDNGYYLIVGPRYGTGGDRIYLNILRGSINLAQRVSGVWTGLVGAAVTTEEGVEYTIRVVCDDSDVKVYRAAPDELEELVLETSNCTMTYTNYVTFTPSTDADFAIDNIRILSDDLSNTTTFAVNNANELTSMTDYNGTTTFGFDDWGRMTSKARGSYEATYGYRYGQMLRSVTSDFPGEGNVTYEYGGDGKRRAATHGTEASSYSWGLGTQAVSEEDENGALARTHVNRFADILGSDPSSGSTRYYFLDRLGSTRSMRNQSRELVSEFEYEPYGETYFHADVLLAMRGFSGMRADGYSGFYFTRFRMYMPSIGRWISREPARLDGPNLYEYGFDNPVLYVDPWGLFPFNFPSIDKDWWDDYLESESERRPD